MKNLYLFLVLTLLVALNLQTVHAQNLDSLQNQVMKLMKYYEAYDNGSPDSLKKALYNNAAKEISGETATKNDIDESFKIVDWYITGDKAIGEKDKKGKPIDEDFDEFIENSDEAKAAINYINQQKSLLQNMSYPEFESFCEKASPFAPKTDIKKAYNQMHANDGKQVSISLGDETMTEAQKQMWAFDVLNNPKNYEDFKKACKIMDPNIPDSKIKTAWAKKEK